MNPTNNPQGSFDDFVRDTVQQELAKQGKLNPTEVPPAPLQLNVGGQVFSYKDKAELEASLNNFVGATGQKFAELQQQIDSAQQPTGKGAYVSGDEPANAWDDAQFVKHMTESPREGFNYWINHELFDGKSQNPVADLKESLQNTELTKRSIAAYQFKENHPEFPGGAQFAQKIDEIRQQMGLPYDVNGLDAAYLVGMQRGFLPNFYQIQQQQQQAAAMAAQQGQTTQDIPWGQQQQPWQQAQMDPRQFNGGFGMNGQMPVTQNPYLAPPPGVNRNAPFAPQGQVNYDDLSTEQIEAIFARAGRPVR